MMKFILTILALVLPIVLVAILIGFYPVAIVEGTPILFYTWQKIEKSSISFTNVQEKSKIGGRELDFSAPENAQLLLDIKRSTLTFLIEDAILKKEGEKMVDGFERESRQRMAEAVKDINELRKAAEFVYGLKYFDFQKLILLPQARRDVLREALTSKGQDFDDWFAGITPTYKVRLFFVPFSWNGKFVR